VTIAFQREYVDLLDGDAQAAIMLSQLVYWYSPTKEGKPKLCVYKDNMFWIAKSGVEWTEETRLSGMKVRRCIKVLERKGLIEVKKFRFDGSPTNHFRLLCANGDPLLVEKPFMETQGKHTIEENNKSICCEEQIHLLPLTNPFVADNKSITESTAENTAECNTVLTHDTKMGFLKNLQTKEETKKPRKTEELVTNLNELAQGSMYGEKNKESILNLWQSRMAKKTGAFQLALNKKDANQLKMFEASLGKEKAFQAIEFAFTNWYDFMKRVGLETGFINLPGVPNLSYLLKYRQQLLNCMESIATPTHFKTEAIHYGTPIPKIVKEKGYKPTPEELAELEKKVK